jgi:myo-inositol-1(or 4)-monophosphatase
LDRISHASGLVAGLTEATLRAGEIALGFFRPGEKTSAEINHKAGGSPVTEADYQVDRFLEERLRILLPEAGWLSEETEDSPARLSKNLVLIVDPIDGTRGFVAGDPAWAISVALIADGRPLVGIVHSPALDETYIGVRDHGARLNDRQIAVSAREVIDGSARLAGPKALVEDLRRAGLQFDLQPKIPSLAVRLVRVASGALDAGFASENAHDWDIAAADLILQEAGGRLTTLDGSSPIYNRTDTRHGLLAAGPVQIHAELIAAAQRAKGLR